MNAAVIEKKRSKRVELRRTNNLTDFSKVGGLSQHIKLLKELIIFPLIYSEVYTHFKIKPPRGVLFYGPPGTGKTLVAGALAAELNKLCLGKVNFYSRKGADILDKWVGESERKLRDLFEKAARTKPSVIFFDELDGLAPERSQKNEQVHSSIVATLLALMDGLDNMPGVVVIGATNRIDTIDPALRRPGRFDRELYFPLPTTAARKEILQIHMNAWKHNVTSDFISCLAELTTGFCGSDLNALCTETVMCCLKRMYPDLQKIFISKKVKIDISSIKIEETDFLNAKNNVISSSQKNGQRSRKLSPFIQPLLGKQLNVIMRNLNLLWPHFTEPGTKFQIGFERYAGRILLIGSNLQGVNTHLVPAILQELEHLPAHILDIPTVFSSSFKSARQNLPCILVLYRIDEWWDLLESDAQISIVSALEDLHAGLPLLMIATCNNSIPEVLKNYFCNNTSIVINIDDPNTQEREEFFAPLFFAENRNSLIKVLRQCKPIKENKAINLHTQIKSDIKVSNRESVARVVKRKLSILSFFNLPEKKPKLSEPPVNDITEQKCVTNKWRLDEDNKITSPESIESLSSADNSFGIEDSQSRKKSSIDQISIDKNVNSYKRKVLLNKEKNFSTVLTDLLNYSSTVSYFEPTAISSNTLTKYVYMKEETDYSKGDGYLKPYLSFGDSKDPKKVLIFNLWKRTSQSMSQGLSVGLLELLYDSISACINLHQFNFELLIENIEKTLDNFEQKHIKNYL